MIVNKCGSRIVPRPANRPPLDDRIRELCTRVVATRVVETGSIEPRPVEIEYRQLQALAELKSALREHNQRLRNLAATKLLGTARYPKPISSWHREYRNREGSKLSLL
jgi:hypothetical protein